MYSHQFCLKNFSMIRLVNEKMHIRIKTDQVGACQYYPVLLVTRFLMQTESFSDVSKPMAYYYPFRHLFQSYRGASGIMQAHNVHGEQIWKDIHSLRQCGTKCSANTQERCSLFEIIDFSRVPRVLGKASSTKWKEKFDRKLFKRLFNGFCIHTYLYIRVSII